MFSREVQRRVVVFFLGLMIAALGVGFIVKSELGVSEILCLSQFHNVVCFPGKAVRLWNVVEQANCHPEGFAHPIHFILV